MNVAIRCDASSEIGTGHFMRCLTLALALKNRGAEVMFFCRDLPCALTEILFQNKIQFISLILPDNTYSDSDLEHSSWLRLSQDEDAKIVLNALGKTNFEWLLVDHYALDFRWEEKFRNLGIKIFVIDDLADRKHDCDILLDQNLHVDMEKRYFELVPSGARMLLGPKYALLRDEFRLAREQVKLRAGGVKNILISFGGSDLDNCTEFVLESLGDLDNFRNLEIMVVIGSEHCRRKEISDRCKIFGYSLHVQTNRMANLMLAADLSIGAGGATSWERCALGLPSLIIALANNQIEIARSIHSSGLGIYIGEFNVLDKKIIANQVLEFISSPKLLEEISRRSLAAVDCNGADRICEIMGS